MMICILLHKNKLFEQDGKGAQQSNEEYTFLFCKEIWKNKK